MKQSLCLGLLISMATTMAMADNNLMTTLLDMPEAEDATYAFTNPRDGWIFVAVGPDESMRFMKSGQQEVTGVAGKPLVVRAVPEIVHSGLGYRPSPFLSSFPRYGVWPTSRRSGFFATQT